MVAEDKGLTWTVDRDFIVTALRHQVPRAQAHNGGDWTTWLMLGGRGAGKTRLGAEWVRAVVEGIGPYAQAQGALDRADRRDRA